MFLQTVLQVCEIANLAVDISLLLSKQFFQVLQHLGLLALYQQLQLLELLINKLLMYLISLLHLRFVGLADSDALVDILDLLAGLLLEMLVL